LRLPRHFAPRNDRKEEWILACAGMRDGNHPHPNPLPPGERGKRGTCYTVN